MRRTTTMQSLQTNYCALSLASMQIGHCDLFPASIRWWQLFSGRITKQHMMIKYLSSSLSIKSLLAVFLMTAAICLNAQIITIPINTDSYTLLLQTDRNNILKTVYFGELISAEAVPEG